MSELVAGFIMGSAAVLITQYLAPKVFGLYIGSIPIDPDLYHKYKQLTSVDMTPESHAKLWSELCKDYPIVTEGKWAFDRKNFIIWRRR